MSTARQIHVGTPPTDFPRRESITVNFHDFANLTTEKNKKVWSHNFDVAGFEWSLKIYSGGDRKSSDGMIAAYLYNKSPSCGIPNINDYE
jgi:hypothetical protein